MVALFGCRSTHFRGCNIGGCIRAHRANRIKEIIENQGHKTALKVLDAWEDSSGLTLRDWFKRHLEIKAIEIEDGTIFEYEKEAERT